jgi:hypothetical protein
MYCINCGSKLQKKSKYCNSCGAKISRKEKLNLREKEDIQIDKPKKKLLNIIVSYMGFIVGLIVSYLLIRFLGLIAGLILIILFILGFSFPGWYLRKRSPSEKIINFIIWSNILTWLLPPIGLFTSVASLGFISHFEKPAKTRALVLGLVGLILTIINSIVGAYFWITS